MDAEATPLECFMRLLLSNAFFGDDVRLEQVILDDGGDLRVVTSQPLIVGSSPLSRRFINCREALPRAGYG
jgi:hypothetical protein